MTFSKKTNISAMSALLVFVLSAISNVAAAHSYTLGNLQITHPYTVPSPFFGKTGAAYIRGIINKGGTPDALVSASTPAAASVEIHTMKMDGDIMRMREVNTIALPGNSETTMRHDERGANGYHFMLIDLKDRLKVGDQFPLILKFEKAGTVEVTVVVQKAKSDEPDNAVHSKPN
jgi:periplasmic copper chaperone A